MKGIAISFLLFYHCFSKKSRMGGMYVDFAPLSREAAMMISRCMVQCVGLFAFLSVYGLTRSVKKKYQSYEFSGKELCLYWRDICIWYCSLQFPFSSVWV